ncbi:nucleoside-diphosphate sugar epimerase/dehydratase [Caproiciproducens galactitolivorans]|uniref:Nucleoside-diphosphate sugar epimerase/dehydratase n=1 Tax=Caproiciproducens galactitolivorans TaxID=642589 RepID=A0ABT4BQC1_9FIRM|nr:nucleoside-diphosphate sugar epimerase/dehydratase [Caproiciproducens galactitolivorans]MCY1713089.1 nucleoside-diphosphate sugar epimerase/dehydratase [Caproiciproducens galactitolivorans]
MKNQKATFGKSFIQIIIDILCVFFSYWIAFILRYDGQIFPRDYDLESFRAWMPWITVIYIASFFLFRFYSTMWQFASLDELLLIFYGTTFAALIVTITGFAFSQQISWQILHVRRFPWGVYIMAWVIAIFLVGASRFSFRLIRRMKRKSQINKQDSEEFHRVMVIGAGEMGSMVIKDMKTAPESKGIPVIAIDDDRRKRGTRIHGVKVVGGRESIPKMAARYNIDQILLAIASAKKKDKQDILNICSKTGCQLKTIPALYEIIEDSADPLKIRDVDIIDLLGRDEIHLNTDEISGYLKNKTVLVTGGGGSIGSELCRQIAYFNPKKLIIFDIYENNAYDLQNELLMRFKHLNLEVLIGSVRDKGRIEHVFSVCKPDVVFHAAAHKHVPLMEMSPGEAVKNNVFGTLNVAQTCDKFGVKRMVLISTDKAVNPTNIMGATKRICELIIQYYSRHSKTDYVAVRFGNVLGSNGSVIPLFKKQIANGGPVTVTHPDIIRYFMTIPEAARLVIQAGGMARGGEIFVLDMGQPVKIVDLARNLIRLSGLQPDVDIKIVYTGLRPGEKLYEELLLDSEGGCQKTSHELIYIGTPIPFNEDTFISQVEQLRAVAGVDNVKMMGIVHELVPTYSGHAEETDALAN